MAYSALTAKSELEAMLHGTTLNQVQNINGVFNRAARQLLLDIDPQETKRISPFTSPIFNGVFYYSLPTDIKGNRVVDIRPQANRTPIEKFAQVYNQAFDLFKNWTLQLNFT